MKAETDAEIDLVVSFVNTHDLEEETDSIAEPEQLAAWAEAASGEPMPTLAQEDVTRIQALREAVRALLRANHGDEASERELQPLREAAERARYRATFSAAGQVTLEPACADIGGFEARLLLAIECIQSQGLWPRLKACTDGECQWAFYDSTRNRSRTWCSMEVCGNREKTRRYRERQGAG